jgi:hypothetical protein
MILTGSDRWYVLGSALVTATQAGLSASVGRSGMVPGEIAWDDCTCEGLLAVSLPRIFKADVFPSETEGPVGVSCHAPYEVGEYTVSVLRCVPNPEGQDMSPDAADLDISAGLLAQDMTEAMTAVHAYLCGLQRDDTIDAFMVTPAEAQGPSGACVGFVLRVLIALAV